MKEISMLVAYVSRLFDMNEYRIIPAELAKSENGDRLITQLNNMLQPYGIRPVRLKETVSDEALSSFATDGWDVNNTWVVSNYLDWRGSASIDGGIDVIQKLRVARAMREVFRKNMPRQTIGLVSSDDETVNALA